jgi:hypothetical protein
MGVVGGFMFAISFFWFGWTSYPSISYWAPMMSGLVFGVSLMFLFVSPVPRFYYHAEECEPSRVAFLFLFRFQLSLFNYLIDTYLFESASALSAATIVRSIFGATFPVRFSEPSHICSSLLD